MEDVKKQIEDIVNDKIRPRTRVDGGDIMFDRVCEGVVYIDAYADCATCQCCDTELSLWITRQVKKELGIEVAVNITKHKPYFA